LFSFFAKFFASKKQFVLMLFFIHVKSKKALSRKKRKI